MSQDVWVTVSEIGIDSETQYESDQRVRRTGPSGTIIYSGKVTAWGSFEQEITLPPGPPRISEATIEIADPFRIWRDLLSHQTARRRIVRINLLKSGTSLADSVTVYTGEIVKEVFPPAKVVLHLRDYLFSWFDEPFAVQVIPELYPDVDLAPEDVGGVIPIIIGSVRSVNFISPSIAQGVIPLPHIGLVGDGASPETFVDRWGIACHPIFDLVAVYRLETSQINVNEAQPDWVFVDPSEYTISETEFTAGQNPFGFGAFSVTNLDFLVEQPRGTQIRIDCDGIERRGPWGPLPATNESPRPLLRNPIDAFINLTYTLLYKAGVSVDIWDTDEIGALREDFEVGFGSPPVIPYCDCAITEVMTAREILGQFLASFNIFMFVNRMGKGTLKFIVEGDAGRPVIKEGKHIIKESFIEEKPEFVANQTQLRFMFNNGTGKYESPTDTIIDNTTEQTILELNGVSKIEKEVFDLPFVRDESTAVFIQSLRNDFLSLGSFHQEFRVPAVPVLDFVEPATLIGLTHSMGLETTYGYVNREALITNVLLDLDRKEFRLRTVLREPQDMRITAPLRPAFAEIYDDPAHINPIRSTGSNPELSIDNDEPIGQSVTAAQLNLIHTNSIAQYVHLHISEFPEPLPGFTGYTVHCLISYTAGTATLIGFNYPIIELALFDQYVTEAYGETPWVAHRVGPFAPAHDCSTDLALTDCTISYSAALFNSTFPGGATDIHLRAELYGGGLEDFSPVCTLKIHDCWVVPTYE